MPNLLSINTYHYRRGGSDAVFFEHDALFRGAGWDTAVMTMHHPKNEASPWSEFFVDELEFGHAYGLLQKLLMAGKVIYSAEARQKLDKLLARFQPDVAHVHCIYHHISPSVLPLLKQRGIPVVMTAHDLKLCCPAYKMLNRGGICEKCKGGNLLNVVTNRCLRDSLVVSSLVMVESAVHRALGLYRDNLDRIVVPSLFFRDKHIEWGWPAEKLVYIPNFVRAEGFTPQFEPGDYFFYFGRLALEKGVGTLIRAAARAGVRLHIAGTGPEGDALKALAAEVGGDIEFLGFVSGDPLWKLLREARAIVLPSEWYENAPMSVLEAYASGKPVIGARIGGIPEMVMEGETGWLFESGSVDELAGKLAHMQSQSGAEISAMGQAARRVVEERFNERQYLDAMLQLYESLGVRVNPNERDGLEPA
ncbi:glycosyltransferase [Thiobacillus sp.]|uniref:glycosyltransferase n=1 Tax=Thiobacillus sp. TaxID=924 RepID=UPI00286E23A8|nr:glycosyltransferase [Thiobacillus sp.]